MPRITLDKYYLKIASVVSERATCQRRRAGCVLLNKLGHILATGYNGRARSLKHCNEGAPCAGAFMSSGTGLDMCEAIHAEQNALLQCRDVMQIDTCYVTVSPCITCIKLLLNTSCRRVVFAERYAQNDLAESLWKDRAWVFIPGGKHA